jgi:hypothetical protein
MRVRDMEYQIPIPYLRAQDGAPPKPDFSIIQRAWWDVINLVYADSETPMRLTLELRIMSGSNIIMAPQRGNDWGTASIEILTLPDSVSDGEWAGFCQAVSDKWMSYTDAEGRELNVRPHWAKEWYVPTTSAEFSASITLVLSRDHAFRRKHRYTGGMKIWPTDKSQGIGDNARSPRARVPQNRRL